MAQIQIVIEYELQGGTYWAHLQEGAFKACSACSWESFQHARQELLKKIELQRKTTTPQPETVTLDID